MSISYTQTMNKHLKWWEMVCLLLVECAGLHSCTANPYCFSICGPCADVHSCRWHLLFASITCSPCSAELSGLQSSRQHQCLSLSDLCLCVGPWPGAAGFAVIAQQAGRLFFTCLQLHSSSMPVTGTACELAAAKGACRSTMSWPMTSSSASVVFGIQCMMINTLLHRA